MCFASCSGTARMLRPTSQSLNENVESFNTAFEKWSNKQIDNIDMTRAQHTKNMRQTKAKIVHVEKEKMGLESLLNTQQREAMEKKTSIKSLQKSVYELETQLKTLPQTMESLQMKETMGSQEIEKKSKEVEKLNTDIESQVQQLTKGISYYSDRLGLDFEQSRGVFWLKFWLIDPEKINAHYIVGLMVDAETYHYRVLSHNPTIEGMDALLEELNLSQDFSRFVQKVRKAFVEIAKANPGTEWNMNMDYKVQAYQTERMDQGGADETFTPGEDSAQDSRQEREETAGETGLTTSESTEGDDSV